LPSPSTESLGKIETISREIDFTSRRPSHRRRTKRPHTSSEITSVRYLFDC
jgi:hypothetical protein